MSNSLQATEDASAAVAKAPRITKEFIEDNISGVYYATADAIADAACGHLTLCILLMKNGFMAVGESAPMSPANFNADLGKQLAYENAFRKLWPLYAFATMEENFLFEQDEADMKAQMKAIHDDGETP